MASNTYSPRPAGPTITDLLKGLTEQVTAIQAKVNSIGAEVMAVRESVANIATDTDNIDRALRPHGDGTRLPTRRRW